MPFDIEIQLPGIDKLNDEERQALSRELKPVVVGHVNRTGPVMDENEANIIIKPRAVTPASEPVAPPPGGQDPKATQILAALRPLKAIIKPHS